MPYDSDGGRSYRSVRGHSEAGLRFELRFSLSR